MMRYGIPADVVSVLKAKFAAVLPHLDERSIRLVLAGEARSLGHGGIAAVARAWRSVPFADSGRAQRTGGRGGAQSAGQTARRGP